MAEEPMSAAAALLAVTEDERLIHPRDTKVDQFAQNIEDRVSNLVGGVSTWFSGINTQTQNAVMRAQDHVDKNGGVLSTARFHLARLESQFQSQSDRARENQIMKQAWKKSLLLPLLLQTPPPLCLLQGCGICCVK